MLSLRNLYMAMMYCRTHLGPPLGGPKGKGLKYCPNTCAFGT
jgi:hypothetical protein